MRSPLVAGLLSGLLWPGAGQFYNKQPVKGILISLLVLILLGLFLWRLLPLLLLSVPLIAPDGAMIGEAARIRSHGLRDPSLQWTLYALLTVWLYGIIDAAIVARRAATRSFQSHKG